jgi:hypothetical protein
MKSVQGGYEPWLQAELGFGLCRAGVEYVVRERPYPDSREKVDFHIHYRGHCFAVEAKIESMTNKGRINGLVADPQTGETELDKMFGYDGDLGKVLRHECDDLAGPPSIDDYHKLVLVVVYSEPARSMLKELHGEICDSSFFYSHFREKKEDDSNAVAVLILSAKRNNYLLECTCQKS